MSLEEKANNWPDGTAEVLVRLRGLKDEPAEPAIVGLVVRLQGDDPFVMVQQACEVIGDRLEHLGAVWEVKVDFLCSPWTAEVGRLSPDAD